ncbi:MAG: peptidase MA family metallohydrolase [Chloroflexota bacterium]
MRYRSFYLLLALFALMLLPMRAAWAAPVADVTDDTVRLDFPNTITFSARLQSSATITSVTLEYGTTQQTCGEVIAKAYPRFSPAPSLDVEWAWDMRQSGSLPPGATIWWRWHFIDESGGETVSERQTVTWLDDVHPWQTMTEGDLRLHWYGIEQAFAREMLAAGAGGLEFNDTQSGLTTDAPIDLYVYPNYDDMRDAILYEPSWTGGMAFSDHNIVIIGTSSGADTDWDKDTVVHELTHVLVGHLTFSCLGDVPTWLNEGLAVYSEGELDASSAAQLNAAIRNNDLLSVRSLSVGFSEVADKASLSYSQSYSIVKFLLETYGQDKMTELLEALRDGATVDEALLDLYGFDVDGLEDAWRAAIGADPRPVSAQPTAQPTPTVVPTYAPVSGAPLAVTPTPYAIPTSSVDDIPSVPLTPVSGPPIGLTIALLCFCCVFGLLIGVIVLGVVLAQRRKGGNHVQS